MDGGQRPTQALVVLAIVQEEAVESEVDGRLAHDGVAGEEIHGGVGGDGGIDQEVFYRAGCRNITHVDGRGPGPGRPRSTAGQPCSLKLVQRLSRAESSRWGTRHRYTGFMV